MWLLKYLKDIYLYNNVNSYSIWKIDYIIVLGFLSYACSFIQAANSFL